MLESIEVIDIPLSDVLPELVNPLSSLQFSLAEVYSDFIYWKHKLEWIQDHAFVLII